MKEFENPYWGEKVPTEMPDQTMVGQMSVPMQGTGPFNPPVQPATTLGDLP